MQFIHQGRSRLCAALVATMLGVLITSPSSAQSDEIVVGVDVGANPYVIGNMDGSVTGYNVDLMAKVAEQLGASGVRYVDQQFSGIFAGLEAGRYQFIAAPVTMTEERAQAMLFIESFIGTAYQFLLPADAPDVTSIEDLKGKVIAVNNGSAYDTWLTAREDEVGFTIERYGKNADAFQAVLAGRADAAMSGDGNVMYAATQNKRLKPSLKIATGSVFSWAFRKDDTELRAKIERAVECLKLDGTVTEIYRTWFGSDPEPGSPPVVVHAGLGQPGFTGYELAFTEPDCGS